jgi:hypothetical protein
MEFYMSYKNKRKNENLKKTVLIQRGAFLSFEMVSTIGGIVGGSSGRMHLEVESATRLAFFVQILV